MSVGQFGIDLKSNEKEEHCLHEAYKQNLKKLKRNRYIPAGLTPIPIVCLTHFPFVRELPQNIREIKDPILDWAVIEV